MTDMNELVLNRLIAEVHAHKDTKSELDVERRWGSNNRTDISTLTAQNQKLSKDLIEATTAQEDEHRAAHQFLIETNSLRAELTRLAEQHRDTVDAMRTLVIDLESYISRPNENVRGALKSANSHLKLIEPI